MLKRSTTIVAFLIIFLTMILAACQTPTPPTPPSVLAPTLTPVPDPDVAFAANAFPPTMPDQSQHYEAWLITDCLACHSSDIPGEAPAIVHKDLPEILLDVNCRTCHVLEVEETAANVSK